MAKYKTKKVKGLKAGLEKFVFYASPRKLTIVEDTYAEYKVVHNGKVSRREAVKATKVNDDGTVTFGWIINLGGKQRKFVENGSGYEVYDLSKDANN